MQPLNLHQEDWSNVRGDRTDSQLNWAPFDMDIVFNSLEPNQIPDEFEVEIPGYWFDSGYRSNGRRHEHRPKRNGATD